MKLVIRMLFSASLLAAVAGTADAVTLLTQLVSPSRGTYGGTIGIQFTANANLTVTSLGFQDAGGDGLNVSHQVGIWRIYDGALLASATVQAGTASPLNTNWRYESVGPVVLIAGENYILAAQDGGTDIWTDAGNDPGFSMTADATIVRNLYQPGSFAMPNLDGGGTGVRWGLANMQYTVVPEPGTSALLAVAGCCLLLRRRPRR